MIRSVLCGALGLVLLSATAGAQQANPWMGAPRPGTAPPSATLPPGVPKPTTAAPRATSVPLPIPRPASVASATPDETAPAPSAQPAPAAPAPVVTASTRPAALPTAPVDNSPRGVIERANASLSALGSFSAEFTQSGANGKRQSGNLFVQKPGKMRFEYDAPNPVEIVSDGSSVAIRDRKLNTQDLYSIGQTPLKFLLRERVDLARDTKVVEAKAEPDMAVITIEDKSTFGGTSRVTLFFDNRNFALKQWIVVDPQGYETQVSLRNINTSARLDPKLFDINYMRLLQ